ncbi:prepilin-type N-terminal cleavage/methylation domain-containing protein [Saccharibacillus alkalitolerans]|uniref:Prepilin-type N-terminal cleavage/methylation domain-containing protein n=1 Tax=Saccharibacillus alkalitolerans TaxID=2705290 RepID=A0ABX0F7Y9_9BACL|nr:prepilin-type N-terminal cleavage/methylation domain-containing protein [Saccharibacillus alkalitolerans]NGZ76089.1 prepilin-type N-terminal cleavage/methylation domain-containing protein [Saccharibacillus alkalitolerans]
MLDRLKKEQGFTLIEVLAALLIVSITALAFTAYFSNAMTFAKTNQNKTIMSNLARNALVYMQKQDFERLEAYFDSSSATVVRAAEAEQPRRVGITPETFENCTASSSGACAFRDIFEGGNLEPVTAVLSPRVNGIAYRVVIEYQQDLNRAQNAGGALLLPISATVTTAADGAAGPGANAVTVEGYVNAQSIR